MAASCCRPAVCTRRSATAPRRMRGLLPRPVRWSADQQAPIQVPKPPCRLQDPAAALEGGWPERRGATVRRPSPEPLAQRLPAQAVARLVCRWAGPTRGPSPPKVALARTVPVWAALVSSLDYHAWRSQRPVRLRWRAPWSGAAAASRLEDRPSRLNWGRRRVRHLPCHRRSAWRLVRRPRRRTDRAALRARRPVWLSAGRAVPARTEATAARTSWAAAPFVRAPEDVLRFGPLLPDQHRSGEGASAFPLSGRSSAGSAVPVAAG